MEGDEVGRVKHQHAHAITGTNARLAQACGELADAPPPRHSSAIPGRIGSRDAPARRASARVTSNTRPRSLLTVQVHGRRGLRTSASTRLPTNNARQFFCPPRTPNSDRHQIEFCMFVVLRIRRMLTGRTSYRNTSRLLIIDRERTPKWRDLSEQKWSAGHPGAANLKLTFHLDHSAGADHLAVLKAKLGTRLTVCALVVGAGRRCIVSP